MSNKVNFNEEYKKLQQEQRKRLLQASRPSSKSGSSGGSSDYERPAWRDRMEYFSPSSTPTRIRLIPHNSKTGWYRYQVKWVQTPKGKRQIIANYWGNGDFPERELPCVLNYYALKNQNGEWLNLDEKMAISVLVLEDHYKVPKMSKANREYFVYERSMGVDKHGRSLDPVDYQSYDKVFGRKLHWSMSPWQHKNFMSTLLGLTDKCANCGEGEISVYAYDCAACGKTIADHREDDITRDAEHNLQNSAVECPHCGNHGKAVQQFECVKQDGYKGEWVEGCGNAKRLDLTQPFDLVIRAVPAGKSTAIEVLSFGPTNPEIEVKDWMTKPFDFDKFFGKMDLDEQATVMGVENPFDEASQVALDNYFTVAHDEEDEDSIPF